MLLAVATCQAHMCCKLWPHYWQFLMVWYAYGVLLCETQ
jgi:hypothetical protein